MLEKINKPNDIHKIALADFPQLADEIRQFLIESVSQTGGHLASNLGVVELTLALHNVLDLPQDKIVWDVGHQAYTHKILTGRKEEFKNLRKEGGMSGFPKRCESDCDTFDAGHSSNSISAGLGYVRARDLLGQNYRVVSVIGDGALTGGMAYEEMCIRDRYGSGTAGCERTYCSGNGYFKKKCTGKGSRCAARSGECSEYGYRAGTDKCGTCEKLPWSCYTVCFCGSRGRSGDPLWNFVPALSISGSNSAASLGKKDRRFTCNDGRRLCAAPAYSFYGRDFMYP